MVLSRLGLQLNKGFIFHSFIFIFFVCPVFTYFCLMKIVVKNNFVQIKHKARGTVLKENKGNVLKENGKIV